MDFFEAFLGNAVEMLLWVQNATGFPEWINRHGWVWPIGETLHFVGLCLLIGAVGLFDLRLIGVAKGLPFAALQRLIPWGVLGFLISLSTGVMFVLGNGFAPGEYLRNTAFFWKMLFCPGRPLHRKGDCLDAETESFVLLYSKRGMYSRVA